MASHGEAALFISNISFWVQ